MTIFIAPALQNEAFLVQARLSGQRKGRSNMSDAELTASHEDASASHAGGDQGNPDLAVRNQSRIGRMLWIGFYTTIFNILTLTFFRFWGRTHFRRQLWADTSVGGEPLEYTGRGLELFVGFVIAIFTFMLPFIGVLIAGQLLLGPELVVLFIIPLYFVLFVIIGAAIYLARRYHLSRTRYRGIRFAQTGSAWGYGFATLGYLLLTGVTLGIAGPYARLRLSRMLWNGAWYGSERFSYANTEAANKEPVYLSFAVAWIGSIAAYIGWAVVLFVVLGLSPEDAATGSQDIEFILTIYLSIIPLALVIGLFIAWHEAVMIRKIVKSLSVAGARFNSRISAWDVLELAVTNTLLIIFTLGVGVMAAQMRVWKRIANRMSLEGDVDFAAIRQNEDAAPKQGEGLADGLDLISNF